MVGLRLLPALVRLRLLPTLALPTLVRLRVLPAVDLRHRLLRDWLALVRLLRLFAHFRRRIWQRRESRCPHARDAARSAFETVCCSGGAGNRSRAYRTGPVPV